MRSFLMILENQLIRFERTEDNTEDGLIDIESCNRKVDEESNPLTRKEKNDG
jgi:hypothetical protein